MLRKGKAVFAAASLCQLRRKLGDKSGQKSQCKNGGLSVGIKAKPSVFAPTSLAGLVSQFPPQLAVMPRQNGFSFA
jgi:hypothetical protein